MKTLSTEQQVELQQFFEKLVDEVTSVEDVQIAKYWAIEFKPKRVRKKVSGLDLNTEEGVIEQAYQEHIGNI